LLGCNTTSEWTHLLLRTDMPARLQSSLDKADRSHIQGQVPRPFPSRRSQWKSRGFAGSHRLNWFRQRALGIACLLSIGSYPVVDCRYRTYVSDTNLQVPRIGHSNPGREGVGDGDDSLSSIFYGLVGVRQARRAGAREGPLGTLGSVSKSLRHFAYHPDHTVDSIPHFISSRATS
jgi:hypothetical protein